MKKKTLMHLRKIIISFILTIFFLQSYALQKTIVFGVPLNYLPYSSVNSNGFVSGFSINLSQLLCKEINAKCLYKPMPHTQLFAALSANKIDAAIGGIDRTPSREAEFTFTIPYLPSTAIFVADVDAGKGRFTKVTPQILAKLNIGVVVGSAFIHYMKRYYPNVRLQTYANSYNLVDALHKDKIDLAIMDTASAEYWVNQTRLNLYLVGENLHLEGGVGIMVQKNNFELRNLLNAAIEKVVASPAYFELLNTFFHGYNKKDIFWQ